MCRLWQTRIGFGGPWQRGRKIGQLPLFMVYRLYYQDYQTPNDYPDMGIVLFSSVDWIGY